MWCREVASTILPLDVLGNQCAMSRDCNTYELLRVAENLPPRYCDESANKLLSNEGLLELCAVVILEVSRL